MSNLSGKLKLPANPFWLFLPFLLLYTSVILVLQTNKMYGDEPRYFTLAQNLIHGFYSPPFPHIDFTNGPGYPLLLTPFIALHVPLICIKLLNGIFYYLSVVFLYKSLRHFVTFKIALIFSLFWACYYNAYEALPLMITEPFTIFLIAAALLCLIKVFYEAGSFKINRYIILSGFLLGFLALTKVVFGYVLLVVLISTLVLWVIYKHSLNYKKLLFVLILSFATTTPYLIYTYNLTGKIFYWATSSGNNLYWMTSLNEWEYGSWAPDPTTDWNSLYGQDGSGQFSGGQLNLKNRDNRIAGAEDSIRKYHLKDFEEINKYTGVEKDDAYKRIAFRNIRDHPGKYLQNCISNVGRILFNYPYSYSIQRPGTLVRFPLASIMIVLILFCIIPTFINWKRLPFAIRFLLLFVFVYLGGCILECSEIRMFTMIVPVLLVWISYILMRTMTFKVKISKDSNQNSG
ncbi:MAG: hypothetical protein B6D37_09960 [Sphingobacteriales bacterium UTBCD1]|jgi:4-amino-4-deoxy-L-arabinose transferase-like glycosyltransferase|nr:MAG: hypothetical protein B6D37_09960 [Sphingobacteriales bacterium UTBCD1]